MILCDVEMNVEHFMGGTELGGGHIVGNCGIPICLHRPVN